MRRALACLLPVLVLASCGGDDASKDEAAVRDTAKGLYGALADKDGGKVCELLTVAQRKAVAKGGGAGNSSCERVMGLALTFLAGKDLKDADKAKVTKVAIEGDRATATVEYKGKPGVLGLVREDGEWRISGFNPNKL
jgi:hypothetical protein